MEEKHQKGDHEQKDGLGYIVHYTSFVTQPFNFFSSQEKS